MGVSRDMVMYVYVRMVWVPSIAAVLPCIRVALFRGSLFANSFFLPACQSSHESRSMRMVIKFLVCLMMNAGFPCDESPFHFSHFFSDRLGR